MQKLNVILSDGFMNQALTYLSVLKEENENKESTFITAAI